MFSFLSVSADEVFGGFGIGTIFYQHQSIVIAFMTVLIIMILIIVGFLINYKKIKQKLQQRTNQSNEITEPRSIAADPASLTHDKAEKNISLQPQASNQNNNSTLL